MTILEQAEHIIRLRDGFKKQIENLIISKNDNKITITLKTGTVQQCVAQETLSIDAKNDIVAEYFCENTQKNIEYVIEQWTRLSSTEIRLTFINKSGTNWTIKPKIHQLLLGKMSPKKGLESLYLNNNS